ncbi:uncharacterized protein LOC141902516 isoform X4 [Tubulanus polymorphus]|uniref:uncharacterized protein LOC141902516 isoform X4 n=1 Tax=Tubulanus polymorphus TaxID=672921 RepID=UPI003DA33CBD
MADLLIPSDTAEPPIENAPEPDNTATDANVTDNTNPSRQTAEKTPDINDNPDQTDNRLGENDAGTLGINADKADQSGSSGSRPDSAGSGNANTNARSPSFRPVGDSTQSTPPKSVVSPESAQKAKEREERVRNLREKHDEERKRKVQELREAQRLAQEYRTKQQEERKRKIEELRRRDEERRSAVEERRKQRSEAERDKLEALLRRSAEREAKLESIRGRRGISYVVAFGSGTPRDICEPLDRSRRSSSHTSLVRRTGDDAHQRSHRRAASASAAVRRRYTADRNVNESGSPSKRLSASCSVLSRNRSIDLSASSKQVSRSRDSSPGSRKTLSQSTKSLSNIRSRHSLPQYNSTNLLACNRDPKMEEIKVTFTETLKLTSEKLKKSTEKLVKQPEPEKKTTPKSPQKSTLKATRVNLRRPPGNQSNNKTTNANDSPVRKPRPHSIAGRLPTDTPPTPPASTRMSRSTVKITPVSRSRSSGITDKQLKEKKEKDEQEKKSSPRVFMPKAIERLSTPKTAKTPPKKEASPIKPTKQKSSSVKPQFTLPLSDSGPIKAVPMPILKKTPQKSPAITAEKEPPPRVKSVSAVTSTTIKESDKLKEKESLAKDLASPSSAEGEGAKSAKEAAAEEYKAKLAEKRRQARLEAERRAEEERLKEEERLRLEEEQRLKEEEEQRRFEEEQMRLAEEARKAEEERLQKAIEEAEKKRQEEAERLENERKAKEEADRKAKEEAEKLEKEREERKKKEEEERAERKKRLEMIMRRVKTDSPEAKDRALSPSPTHRPNSPSPTGDGPETTAEVPKFKSALLQNLLGKKKLSGSNLAGSVKRDDDSTGSNSSNNSQNDTVNGEDQNSTAVEEKATVDTTSTVAEQNSISSDPEKVNNEQSVDAPLEAAPSPDEDKDIDTKESSVSSDQKPVPAESEVANQNVESSSSANQTVVDSSHSSNTVNTENGLSEYTEDYDVDNPALLDASLSLKLNLMMTGSGGAGDLATELKSSPRQEFEEVIDLDNSNQTSFVNSNTILDHSPIIAFEENTTLKQEVADLAS